MVIVLWGERRSFGEIRSFFGGVKEWLGGVKEELWGVKELKGVIARYAR